VVARGAIRRRVVTFSDEARWGSNGMQKSQALYCTVSMRAPIVLPPYKSGRHAVRLCWRCDGSLSLVLLVLVAEAVA
jgi:hypothetical protein